MKIGARQTVAITALLEGQSQAQAAARAKVSEMTLHRWRRDADFAAAYSAALRRVFDDGIDKLQAITRKAVRTLEKCLSAKRDGDKVRAALGLLAHALRAAELRDLQDRVAALE